MILQGEKILVTGGAGFIGSHLCDRFIAEGAEVVCLDNLSTGFEQNIEQHLDHERFTFFQGDIRDLETCHRAIEGCTMVSHQAALGSVPRSINDPVTTHNVNTGGFLNVLIVAQKLNIKKFVYASSSSVYGDSEELPKVEERIGKPLSPYAISKLTCESYARMFSEIYSYDTIGLRYFNIFGPRQNPNGDYAAVIPKFINKAINIETIIINGDGFYSRDFTFVENIVDLNILCMTNKDVSGPSLYNGACGERTTILHLAQSILDQLKKINYFSKDVCRIENAEIRQGDIPHSLGSIRKAENDLKYKANISLSAGLMKTINYYLVEASYRPIVDN